MSVEVLKMENITKIYPNGLIANNAINLSVNAGEIHALLGENGAGKTTLMNVLFGIETKQEGQIFINGKEANITNPLDAIVLGVGMVHQNFMLVPSLTVADNVILGIEPLKKGFLDKKKCKQVTQEVAEKYGFDINASDVVRDLSVGQQQKVEILKALIRGVKILIMDEPTAVLTPQETEELFLRLIELKKAGYAIIFITHKLDEVMKICDRITILKHGKSVASDVIENLDEMKISRLMVGRDVVMKIEKPNLEAGNTVLDVNNLFLKNAADKVVIDNISFNIKGGEIVGVAGVEGNGQNELVELISGMKKIGGGNISIDGESIKNKTIQEIRNLGVSHISEDRMRTSTSLGATIKENLMANIFDKKEFKKGPLFDNKKIDKYCDQLIKDYEIKCEDRNEKIKSLSGGNIQKVIVAREFSAKNLKVLLANQPTRGIDIGATRFIRKELVKITREKKVATLLVSADLNEILEVSDRLIVMYKGKIVAHFKDVKKVTEEQLGEYMLGVKKMEESEMKLYD